MSPARFEVSREEPATADQVTDVPTRKHRLLVLLLVLWVAACASGDGAGASPTMWTLPAAPPLGEERLHELAAFLRLDDPPQDVEFERYIRGDEFAAVMVPCLVDYGMPAVVRADGGIGWRPTVPAEQFQAQSEALYRCYLRFPVHPIFEQPLNGDQLRRLYEYQTGELTACLESEGYTVSEPPSLESFTDSYYDPEVVTWHPYPAEVGPTAWDRLNEICPQNPPADVL